MTRETQGRAGAWRRRSAALGSIATVALIVLVLAAYAAAGWLRRRHEDSGTGEPLLFSRALVNDPGGAALVFAGSALAYAAILAGLGWLAERAVRGVGTRRTRWVAAIEWLYARWWRIALVLAVVWSPLLVVRWPGAVNPDFALMVTEIAMTRSEFPPGAIPPYDVYPIAHALIPDGELVWSNQHNAFLTLAYGAIAGASGLVFHSYLPAMALIGTTQALFTLFALGRAIQLVGRHVDRAWVKAAALAVTAAGAMIPLWSMDFSKNPLFAAAFVWWLALVAERVLGAAHRRLWVWEALAATSIMVLSVKFGVYVAVSGAVLLLLQRAGWRRVVVGMIAPVVVLQGLLQILIAAGVVIPDDPVEARVAQLQQIALTLREDPSALSGADREALSRIFDPDVMARVYVPENADPVKSSGFDDNGSYKWKSVQPEDWDGFTGLWLRLGAERPDLYLDAFLLKSDMYLDPGSRATPWPPMSTWDWTVSYSLDLSGVNPGGRRLLADGLAAVRDSPVRYAISPSVWAIGTILLCATAIVLRRRGAWTWSIPPALQVGVALLAPLNGSGRYLLGLIYAAGLVFLLLGAVPRPRTPATDSAESEPAPPSERMDQ